MSWGFGVLFLPFYETFISVFKCTEDGGTHYIDETIGCYSTYHIITMILAITGLVILLA